MFFFKKRKSPVSDKTQPLDMLRDLVGGRVACRACGAKIKIREQTPLQHIRCPSCRNAILIPKAINSYHIYRFLAQGGMGTVYKAVSADYPGEQFAVKLLPQGRKDDQKLIDSLSNEAEIAYVFKEYPNVVQPVEFGRTVDEYFYVTEYINGERLDHRVARLGAMPQPEVVSIALQLCKTDRMIYRGGYLYRDLKPENIILEEKLQPVLIDFGLCCPIRDARYHTESEVIDGSPHFMPPERLTGDGEDIYSEIYSLGMLLYFALTGGTFFESGNVQRVAEMYAFRDRKETMLDSLKHISDNLRKVIHRMILRDPRARYQSFEDVEAELASCQSPSAAFPI